MAGKTKPLMFCPFCDDGRAFNWASASKHVKAKHNDKWEEFKKNKDLYLEKFACDESGNPIGGSPEPEPPETPEVEAPAPTPKPNKKPPAPEVKPPTPAPAPKPETKPAEGGGFLDELRQSIFGD